MLPSIAQSAKPCGVKWCGALATAGDYCVVHTHAPRHRLTQDCLAHLRLRPALRDRHLSRSYEDLHPQPDRYEVIWNGTISAQEQKAEQRSPSLELEPVQPEPARRSLTAGRWPKRSSPF
jgi:hypothetical protein